MLPLVYLLKGLRYFFKTGISGDKTLGSGADGQNDPIVGVSPGLNRFNLGQGCSLAVGNTDNLNLRHLIQSGVQITHPTWICIHNKHPDSYRIHSGSLYFRHLCPHFFF